MNLLQDLKALPSTAKKAKTSTSNARDMGKDPYSVLVGRFVEIRKELNEKVFICSRCLALHFRRLDGFTSPDGVKTEWKCRRD
jgi:hypothetical protein